MRRAGVGLGLALLAVVALGRPGATLGHALMVSSDPAADSTRPTSPSSVTLTFTEPPDPKLSSVQVLDASGGSHARGPAAPVTGAPTELRVALDPLPDGVYTVAWRTVSTVDGHAAAGAFAFSVGVAAPTASGAATTGATSGGSSVSPSTVVSRWLLYLGLVGLVGAIVAMELAKRRQGAPRWLAIGAWAVSLAGSLLLVVSETADAGVGLTDLPGTSLGTTALARLLPLAAAGILVMLPLGRWDATRLRVVGLLGAAAMLVDAVVSHAASTSYPALQVAVAWLHFVTVGIWIGGLAGIVLLLRGAESDDKARLVGRFSRWATVGIGAVAATGVIRATSELTSPADLVSTSYGQLIVLKTALLGIVALLAAVNHFRHVPAGQLGLRGIRRLGSLEVTVGVVLLLTASALVNVPPPVEASRTPATSAGLSVDGHDYATSVRLHLDVTPGTAGPDTFRATVVDYDSGAPVDASSVSLRFSFPARPDIGASTLGLKAAGKGVFSATGSNLSLGGTWSVTALVEAPGAPVEVPLTLSVPQPALPVDVNRVAGQPTIYTVHLPAGRAVQLYLDPQPDGSAYLHITFFDASGTELPATDIAATVTPAGGSAGQLALTPLEPGHVVGHLKTRPTTPITVSVTATAPTGEPIAFHLDITPDP